MRCTAPNISAASARVRPLTASLISEADAVEIAQPLPSKRRSRITSPCELDVEAEAVAAQWVVAVGMVGRTRQAAAVPRAPVVVDDHVAIEVGEVHQRSIRIASPRASTSASTSARVL